VTHLWFEITAKTPPALADAVADIVRGVSPGGISIEEPVDILGPEQGFRVRGGEPVLIRCYLPSSELGAVLVEDLRRAMEAYPSVELSARPIYEQDWAVSWREFFGVVETGGRVVVVPSWVEHEPADGQIVIRLDPGQAFGTGHHETTRLCLAMLDGLVRPGARVLDVGTGSGILAIAAVKLGAAAVDAIDIDPVAAEVAAANCAANGVERQVRVRAGRLEPGDIAAAYDLVVSNISPDANIGLVPVFERAVRAGGDLLLSGVLEPDVPRVAAACAAAGFEAVETRLERDWAAIHLRRAG
jgi:ribosomal protein L11 methyltransferase